MRSRSILRVSALLVLSVSATACDDALGPVDSVPIGLTINSMNSSDIEPTGIIEKDENISTETGNPWGEFIRIAEDQCGREPIGFEILSATLGLDVAGSSNVDVLEDVIHGDATLFFVSTQGSDADAVRVDIASGSNVTGVGPVDLTVTASRAELDGLWERLVGGDFHVGLNAETDRVGSDSFSMDAQVGFQARAICE